LTLIKSISGIRGTIGGSIGDNLTPMDVVECAAGFGVWIKKRSTSPTVVVGRDGRLSGEIVSQLAIQTLLASGIDVIDLGLSTTPTVEMMVPQFGAAAGIVFTASHNPAEWNALKFLNDKGEFISAADGDEIIEYIASRDIAFSSVTTLGKYSKYENHIADHISKVLALPLVDIEAVSKADFHVVVDCINSTGAISIPPLLDQMGVKYTLINDDNFGNFAHNPEPLPEHLAELCQTVVNLKANLGISVDPDVDRLAFVSENGELFGEEYTLVAIADYILSRKGGNTVSNLSSTRALADVTRIHGGTYTAAAVGEVNVVNAMKATHAVIGGEGNGGVIVPELHYGRDAIAGIALFLSHLAIANISMTALKATYPAYAIIKDKIVLTPEIDIEAMLAKIKVAFANENLNEVDGLKIDFAEGWVHMRKSNTEPIIRIYCEAGNPEEAKILIDKVKAAL